MGKAQEKAWQEAFRDLLAKVTSSGVLSLNTIPKLAYVLASGYDLFDTMLETNTNVL